MINAFFNKIYSLFSSRKKDLTPGDIASLCKSNKKDDYDYFWSNEDLIDAYMEPARVEAYNFIIEHIVAKGVTGKIVDIGFGSGDFLRILLEKSKPNQFITYGLDYSEAAVSRAKKIIPDGNFITDDVNNLPYDDNFFDLVACIQTLEHLNTPHKVVSEFDRICAPNGLILISIPNGKFDDYEGHVNFWDENQFKKFLAPRIIVDFIHFNNKRAFLVTFKPLKKDC